MCTILLKPETVVLYRRERVNTVMKDVIDLTYYKHAPHSIITKCAPVVKKTKIIPLVVMVTII